MKKKIFLTIISALAVTVLNLSQLRAAEDVYTEVSGDFRSIPVKKIVVFPLSGDYTGATADALTTELLAMGFEVVERSSLYDVLKEMKLSYSGFFNETHRKEVARLLNADAMLFGSVTTTVSGKIYSLGVRLVSLAEGKVLWSSTYLNEDDDDEPNDSILGMSSSIRQKIGKTILTDQGYRNNSSPWVRLAQNTTLPAKKYKRIALLPMTGTSRYGEEEALYSAVLTNLIGYGVEVVERKALDELLGEQYLSAAGLYSRVQEPGSMSPRVALSTGAFTNELKLSRKDLSEIGRLTGADALLIGTFFPVPDDVFKISYANLRVLDLEKGRISWSASYYNSIGVGADNCIIVADHLALALAPAITAENAEQYTQNYENALKRKKSRGSSIIEKLTQSK